MSWSPDTEQMTAELRDELAASNVRRLVDPRTVRVRFHHLAAIAQSPAHALEKFQDDRDETLAMRLGSGTHAITFGQPVAVWNQPAKKGTGKAPRNGAAWDEFCAEHAGKTILNQREYDEAQRIAAAIRSHPIASSVLFAPDVVHEQTIEWTMNGRSRRSTPDARGDETLIELKTSRTVEPRKFERDARFRGYHAQLADQGMAIEAATGWKPLRYLIVSVETVKPYVVHVQQLSERAVKRGEQLVWAWLERLLACEAAGKWPGYASEITTLDVPEDDDYIPEPLVFEEQAFKEAVS